MAPTPVPVDHPTATQMQNNDQNLTPTSTPPSSSDDRTGAIIGGLVLGFFLLMALISLAWFLFRMHQHKQREKEHHLIPQSEIEAKRASTDKSSMFSRQSSGSTLMVYVPEEDRARPRSTSQANLIPISATASPSESPGGSPGGSLHRSSHESMRDVDIDSEDGDIASLRSPGASEGTAGRVRSASSVSSMSLSVGMRQPRMSTSSIQRYYSPVTPTEERNIP